MRRLLYAGALMLFVSPALLAQDPPVGVVAGRGPRPPENLKVLPPDTNLRVEMPKIAEALGVQCTFCHVQGNFPSDEYPTKRRARHMMLMVKALNEQNFPKHERKEGAPLGSAVTCFTCHRGSQKPLIAAPTTSKPGA